MAEVQTNTESGETTQRFIEFVMMQRQNAALFLGLIPNPQSGEPEVNLDIAKMFIDHLLVIKEKTRGNLNGDEAGVLNQALSNLQMAYVKVSQMQGIEQPGSAPTPDQMQDAAPAEAPATAETTAMEGKTEPSPEESKKKFTKSYGS